MDKKFQILPAADADADALAGIIDTVYQQMEHPSWFMPDDADYIRKLMNPGQGLVWKAVEEETGAYAGVFMLLFPGETKENLGNDAGLSEEERQKVAHVESVAILPEYRGHGLQYRMMQMAETVARKKNYAYLLCTVHPENRFSRNNMVKMGFHSVVTKEKYGGFLREVMMKQL